MVPVMDRALGEFCQILLPPEIEWPSEYVNAKTEKTYHPHNDDERRFVYEDGPKHALLKGGWGAGKSAAGYVKTLDRLGRGMDCIAVSPDFEHFRKSLWPVIREWTPWDCVIDKHRYKGELEFEPRSADRLVFVTGASLYYGGIKAAQSWFGGNVHFVLFDEAASYPDRSAFTSLERADELSSPKVVTANGPSSSESPAWLTGPTLMRRSDSSVTPRSVSTSQLKL